MSSDLPTRVARYIDRHALLSPGHRVLVGVSGGPDSMVCLAILQALGYEVSGLHVNHGLRPGAEDEETLVRQYCEKYEVPLQVVSLNAEQRADRQDESLQEAARQLRYNALAEAAREQDIDTVAVGHHRDDQAETLLLNLFRGAGPEGIAGMPPARPLRAAPDIQLVRPLLCLSRSEIEEYAGTENIPWRHDPSNEDLSFDRATLRTKILPRIEEHFPGAVESVARAAGLTRAYVEETLTPALVDRMADGFQRTAHGGWVALNLLRSDPAVWRRRVLLEALRRTLPDAPQSHAVADELAALVDAQPGAKVEVGEGTVWRERERIRFVPRAHAAAPVAPTPVPWGEDVPVETGILRVDPLESVPDALSTGTSHSAYADLDRLTEPLTLRSWQEGDRIQPLGMKGTKLVSDLLTDAQVPPHRRATTCVLAAEEHLAWVIGHRIDHRVRVRPDTERVAHLTWRPRREANRENASDDCNSP